MKILSIFAVCTILVTFCACEKKTDNRVSRQQISSDGSNDYKFMFREEIEKEQNSNETENADAFR
ncbi:MAG: hypothetical protein ACOCWZ_01515 [Spirochaetota bacterium]